MSDIKYTRYIDFSDEARALIKQIWGDDKPSAPYVIVRQAANKGVTVEEYLKGRLNNPNMENGRMPKKFREPLVARMTSMEPRKHTEEAKARLREKHLGKEIPPEHRENMRAPQIGKKMSPEAIAKTVAANTGRKRTPQALANLRAGTKKGADNYAWKGGLYEKENKNRKNLEVQAWKKAVYRRDGFTCQSTGVKGVTINAHHIFGFTRHPKVRTELYNGITLSKEEHKEFHSIYGVANFTMYDLEKFPVRPLPFAQRTNLIAYEVCESIEETFKATA